MHPGNGSRFAARRSLAGIALALFALEARASDWYVDGVSGSNSNAGTAPGSAWKTITHAFASTPQAGRVTIHVLPGTYSPAAGELLPLDVRPQMKILGVAGSAATTIDGGGSAILVFQSYVSGNGWAIGPDTELRGFTLRNGAVGISMATNWNPVGPTLAELVITGMNTVGIAMTTSYNPPAAPRITAVLSNVRCVGNGVGIQAVGRVSLSADACEVSDNVGRGIFVSSGDSAPLSLRRSRLERNGSEGIGCTVYNYGSVQVLLEDCLVAGNGEEGLDAAVPNGLGPSVSFTLRRSTVAHNGGAGVRLTKDPGCGSNCGGSLLLESSILHGNLGDVVTNAPLAASFCEIGDGTLAGLNGNFAADPSFVDVPAGDFRLAWGSPCIESGDPATPAGALDLAGNARPIDGDLDTAEAPDIGAYEHAPLFLASGAHIGTTLELEVWGPQGAPSVVYFARALPLASPISTPYGSLMLDPMKTGIFRSTSAGSGPPTQIVRTIPPSPTLIGLPFSFQALTDSPAAPQGKAYTNAVGLVLQP